MKNIPKVSFGKLKDGAICYVPQEFVNEAFKTEKGICWSYRRQLSTVRFSPIFSSSTSFKSYVRFGDKASLLSIERFVDEYLSSNGKSAPSSFGDAFRLYFEAQKIPHIYDVFIGKFLAGGWQHAFSFGEIKTPVIRYDINSAYGWASSIGLPAPSSYSLCKDYRRPGIYIVEAVSDGSTETPTPFNCSKPRKVLATNVEINKYRLTISKVYWGVSWERYMDIRPAIDMVRSKFTDWKDILRQFWGGWCAKRGPKTGTFEQGRVTKEWQLPNIYRHFIWAAVIISRVKMRVWEQRPMLRVWCDSVLTDRKLPTGNDIGEWKVEKEYPEGVTIHKTGLAVCNKNNRIII